MTEQTDGDMTARDPLSSTAEGDADEGSAELSEAGTGQGATDEDDDTVAQPKFTDVPTPPEASDDTPVEDAAPETNLGYREP